MSYSYWSTLTHYSWLVTWRCPCDTGTVIDYQVGGTRCDQGMLDTYTQSGSWLSVTSLVQYTYLLHKLENTCSAWLSTYWTNSPFVKFDDWWFILHSFMCHAGAFLVPERAGGKYDFWIWCNIPARGSEHRIYITKHGQGTQQVCPGDGVTSFAADTVFGTQFFCKVDGVELSTGKIYKQVSF